MSNIPGSGKPFDELTDAELDALADHDWTAGQIMAAMSAALTAGDMKAVVDLLARLARKDPRKAELILAVIQGSAER